MRVSWRRPSPQCACRRGWSGALQPNAASLDLQGVRRSICSRTTPSRKSAARTGSSSWRKMKREGARTISTRLPANSERVSVGVEPMNSPPSKSQWRTDLRSAAPLVSSRRLETAVRALDEFEPAAAAQKPQPRAESRARRRRSIAKAMPGRGASGSSQGLREGQRREHGAELTLLHRAIEVVPPVKDLERRRLVIGHSQRRSRHEPVARSASR